MVTVIRRGLVIGTGKVNISGTVMRTIPEIGTVNEGGTVT